MVLYKFQNKKTKKTNKPPKKNNNLRTSLQNMFCFFVFRSPSCLHRISFRSCRLSGQFRSPFRSPAPQSPRTMPESPWSNAINQASHMQTKKVETFWENVVTDGISISDLPLKKVHGNTKLKYGIHQKILSGQLIACDSKKLRSVRQIQSQLTYLQRYYGLETGDFGWNLIAQNAFEQWLLQETKGVKKKDQALALTDSPHDRAHEDDQSRKNARALSEESHHEDHTHDDERALAEESQQQDHTHRMTLQRRRMTLLPPVLRARHHHPLHHQKDTRPKCYFQNEISGHDLW